MRPDRMPRSSAERLRAKAARCELALEQPSRVGDRRHGSIPCDSRRSRRKSVNRKGFAGELTEDRIGPMTLPANTTHPPAARGLACLNKSMP